MIRLALGTLACMMALGAAAVDRPPVHENPGRPMIGWNRALLAIVRTPGAQPATIHSTRSFAILHAAIYDAVRAIDRSSEHNAASAARREASESAAADAAAYTALIGLYPREKPALDAEYAAELAKVPDGPAKDEGVREGERVARKLLSLRADDGSAVTPPPFVPGSDPGDYRATPPNFPAPVFTTWGDVAPFVLDRGDDLRPEPPPPLTSELYAAAIDEVEDLGSATSTTRTSQQTEDASFWAAPIQNYWNEIAETMAMTHPPDLLETARVFAVLNLALADSAIAAYDAKYTYRLWRPITAIRLADTDGNPGTDANPEWTPLASTTPPDPSYPGAHSVLSTAAADVLASFFGDHAQFAVTSEMLPGVTHRFTSFHEAAEEAGLSRIYAGVHTRLDHEIGQELGGNVADVVLQETVPAPPDALGD